jgi:hypothetical protein
MGQSSEGRKIAMFAVRMGILFLFVSSALLTAGCADLSADDHAVFYSGWVNPHSDPLVK